MFVARAKIENGAKYFEDAAYQQQMQDRLNTLLNYLNESPDDAFLLFAIAREYTAAEDFDTARTYYHKLREFHPEYVGLYYHLGKLEVKVGAIEEAVHVFNDGLRISDSIGDKHAWSELRAALAEIQED